MSKFELLQLEAKIRIDLSIMELRVQMILFNAVAAALNQLLNELESGEVP